MNTSEIILSLADRLQPQMVASEDAPYIVNRVLRCGAQASLRCSRRADEINCWINFVNSTCFALTKTAQFV